jgi:hypothetical protein
MFLFGGAALLMTGSTFMLKWLYGKVNGLEEDGLRKSRAASRTRKEI